MGIDRAIDDAMRPAADFLSGIIFFTVPILGAEAPLIVFWLVAGGLFFTFYLRFVNIRGFLHALAIVSGRYADRRDPGEISQFRALTTAVAGTVGIGNMAGVAVAISVGGPGAAFWLAVAGALGMSTKFAECTLGVLFRRANPDGSVSGGPMYYLEAGLRQLGRPRLGRGLGIFYAIAMVIGCLGIGNMFQSNQAAEMFQIITGREDSLFADKSWLIGLALALCVGLVIIGGIKSIGSVTVRLVPAMAVIYIFLALLFLILNAEGIPGAVAAIWSGAFAPEGLAGGALGALIVGFRRATFSNEAGLGSAAIAHSTARTPLPASEGYVGLLEPFIDTVVICMMSAVVIVIYQPVLSGGVNGIELTISAFESTLPWSAAPIGVAAILFAFSTMLGWSYYGLKAFTYLAGEGQVRDIGFKALFCIFVVLGASVELESLVNLSDALIFIVAIPNLIGLYIMAPIVRREIARYRSARQA